MQYRNAEEIALRMYRASTALVNSLELCGDPVAKDKVVLNALSRSSQAILSVHTELLNSPRYDPGRIEGYIAGVSDVGQYLKNLEGTKQINAAIESAQAAVEAGMEAFDIIMGRVPGDGGGNRPTKDRSVMEIVEELRAAVFGANELTEEQKRDAFGYIGAISSIMDMANPDRSAFHKLAGGLLNLARDFGNALIIDMAIELVKWGWSNL